MRGLAHTGARVSPYGHEYLAVVSQSPTRESSDLRPPKWLCARQSWLAVNGVLLFGILGFLRKILDILDITGLGMQGLTDHFHSEDRFWFVPLTLTYD